MPSALGRGAIVRADQVPPDGLGQAPRFTIDAAALGKPTEPVDRMHRLWVARTPYVVALAVDPGRLRIPQRSTAPVHDHDAAFEFPLDRLRHLVWANNVDHRGPAPVWWHAVKAARAIPGVQVIGAVGPAASGGDGGPDPDRRRAGPGGAAGVGDVILPDGRAAWIDGGPRQPLDLGDGVVVVHRDDTERGRLVPQGRSTSAVGIPDLAVDQAAAVNASLSAVRVAAPAGSGKTRVLTARLHEVLVGRAVPADTVLALAYNAKAAAELRRRTAVGGPRSRGPAPGVRASTVHAYGLEILRRHLGALAVYEEREVRRVLSDLVEVPRLANVDPLQPYLDSLEQVRGGLVSPDVVQAAREDIEDFPRVFTAYRAHLARQGAVDFGEMVYRAIELLLCEPDIREAEQARVGQVLVDEFQDLTPAYVLLIRLVASPQLQCFGVGDDDQVIYGHAGATPAYLLDFDQLFPGAEDHPLTVNYRCPAAVVDGAVALLGHNHTRLDKVITAGPEAVAGAIIARRVHTTEQAVTAGAAVQAALDDGADLEGIAVLARTRVALLGTQADLANRGIPTRSPIGEWLLARTGVRAALAYLRLATAEAMDGADLAEVLHRPLRPVPGTAREVLRPRRWTPEALRQLADTRFQGRVRRAVLDFVRDLDGLRARARRQPTTELLRYVADVIGLGEAAASLDASAGGQIASSHLDDLEALMQVADHCPDPVLFEPFLIDVVRQPVAAQAGSSPAVTLATIHSVKGLEWPHVVVVGAAEGVCPHRLATTTAAIEEERRVFHVAITRASQQLTVVAPKIGTSRFVAEMLAEPSLVGTSAAPRPGVGGVAGTRAAKGGGRSGRTLDRPADARARPSRFRAAVGLQVRASGGLVGAIESLSDDGALVRTARGSLLRLRYGSEVRVDGAFGTLVRP
ncbi:MAG TPA: ATP-dependent helicase [Euzebya sp.]|nr:ATP-dependent helicase [Euzebya sp.]